MQPAGQSLGAFLPPGITPPTILQYNASNVQVAQLTVKSDSLTEQDLFDYGLNFLRVRLFTIEGLSTNGTLHPVQAAFVSHGVPQCGFCIPGMLMSASALLAENPAPSEAEIRLGIAGNLCRCTGYTKMVAAISEAAGAVRA